MGNTGIAWPIKKIDWILIGAIILLLIIGILSIASISEARTGAFVIFKKQIITLNSNFNRLSKKFIR